jgi:hypothetical protein
VEKLVGGGGRLCRRGVVAAAARRGRGAVAAADAGAAGLWGRLVVAVVTETFPVASTVRGGGITGEKMCSWEGVFAKKLFNGLGCWGAI